MNDYLREVDVTENGGPHAVFDHGDDLHDLIDFVFLSFTCPLHESPEVYWRHYEGAGLEGVCDARHDLFRKKVGQKMELEPQYLRSARWIKNPS